ncbi:MAG: hypothetical protein PF636_02895 [Actinomycetota bacterium]|nr:hypothetical protein [Actinomycetota bacterium]
MDEKVLEEIQFHQETVAKDTNSPLHLIREKEMEISGRVLAAKNEAEQIVSDARRAAVDIIAKAEEESVSISAAHERGAQENVEKEITAVRASADTEAAALEHTASERIGDAVAFTVKRITEV